MKALVKLFDKPSGSEMAARSIKDAERDYLHFTEMSDKHASLAAHYQQEAERVKNRIEWLIQTKAEFDARA